MFNHTRGSCLPSLTQPPLPPLRDSVHFIDIARYGYRFEHSFAFYPLLPVVTGYLARNLAALLSTVAAFTGWGAHAGAADAGIIVATGLFVSTCSFVAMAVLLYAHISQHFSIFLLHNSGVGPLIDGADAGIS